MKWFRKTLLSSIVVLTLINLSSYMGIKNSCDYRLNPHQIEAELKGTRSYQPTYDNLMNFLLGTETVIYSQMPLDENGEFPEVAKEYFEKLPKVWLPSECETDEFGDLYIKTKPTIESKILNFIFSELGGIGKYLAFKEWEELQKSKERQSK